MLSRQIFPKCTAIILLFASSPRARAADLPLKVAEVIRTRCLNCHDSATKKGGFDLEALVLGKLPADASDSVAYRKWVRVHDRVRDSEMPTNI
jgi:hypothetical protein